MDPKISMCIAPSTDIARRHAVTCAECALRVMRVSECGGRCATSHPSLRQRALRAMSPTLSGGAARARVSVLRVGRSPPVHSTLYLRVAHLK